MQTQAFSKHQALEISATVLSPGRRPRRATRWPCRASPTVCFAETLGDIMRGYPTSSGSALSDSAPVSTGRWLSWPPFKSNDTSPAVVKAKLKQERVQKLKHAISAINKTNPLQLPQQHHEYDEEEPIELPGSSATLTSADTEPSVSYAAAAAVPWPNAMSNAVPFNASCLDNGFISVREQGPPSMPKATVVHRVLPWLFAAPGTLDALGSCHLASTYALSQVHQLNVSNYVMSGRTPLSEAVCWVGPTPVPSPIVAATATLHRMAHRRGGLWSSLAKLEGKAVVLTFLPQHKPIVAEILALYLHMFGGLEAKDAASLAGNALQCPPPALSSLETRVEELAACAMGWLQKVVVAWNYGGGKVEAAGEAVGGWNRQVPLAFSVQQRRWRVQLWGLPPGVYQFKYLVDGQWCTDLSSPIEVDMWGNNNNVVFVAGCVSQDLAMQTAEASDGMAGMPYGSMDGEEMDDEEEEEPFNQQQEQRANDFSVTPAERLSLARFGGAVLALYMKTATVRKHPVS